MKIKSVLLCASIAFISLSACKTKKEVAAEITLPEIKVNSKPEVVNYYASYTKLSDIIHTKLEISLNWDSCFVIGKATLKVKPYFHPTNELILDAKGYKINEIIVNNRKAEYKYDGYKLKVDLGRKFTKEESYEVFIDYISMPNKLKVKGSAAINSDKGFYFINPDGKNPYKPKEFWTQGETESNSCWFPTIESGGEKFSQEIVITVDTSMVTLSNGRLQYSTNNSNGTRTDYWKQDLPHAPYLAMLAGGKFKIYKDKWRNMEVNYYMEPEFAPYAKLIFGKTPEMIEFFSNKLGVNYPWDKYSQIVVRDFVSGAMENTGAVTFYDDMNKTDRDYEDQPDEDIISHELFHHWFGDLVTCESWPNLPLNESFATYGEYLWDEFKYGRDEADRGNASNLSAYLGTASTKRVNMIRYNLSDRETMFDVNSYQKGGRILHMLRKYLGDEAFFASLKYYLETYKYKSVEIHHLRLAFEEVTGEDLNWFFNQWFLDKGHPELEISYVYDDANKNTTVKISQMQDLAKSPLYKLPIDVDVYADGKVKRTRIVLDSLSQNFQFKSESKPDLINVDAEKMLLCTKKDAHTKEEWMFMFANAPLYLDRLEALNGLDNYKSDSIVQAVFVKALNDPFFSIKTLGLSKVKGLNDTYKKEAYPIVKSLALTGDKSSVRRSAIRILNDVYSTENNEGVYEQALKDKSYFVESELLKIYAKSNLEKAKQIAKKESNTLNNTMRIAIAEFYGNEGTTENLSFYTNIMDRGAGFSMIFISNHFKKFIKRMDDETILKAIDPIKSLATKSTSPFIATNLKSVLKDMKEAADSEESKTRIQAAIDSIK